jgi:hypothetical protein
MGLGLVILENEEKNHQKSLSSSSLVPCDITLRGTLLP